MELSLDQMQVVVENRAMRRGAVVVLSWLMLIACSSSSREGEAGQNLSDRDPVELQAALAELEVQVSSLQEQITENNRTRTELASTLSYTSESRELIEKNLGLANDILDNASVVSALCGAYVELCDIADSFPVITRNRVERMAKSQDPSHEDFAAFVTDLETAVERLSNWCESRENCEWSTTPTTTIVISKPEGVDITPDFTPGQRETSGGGGGANWFAYVACEAYYPSCIVRDGVVYGINAYGELVPW